MTTQERRLQGGARWTSGAHPVTPERAKWASVARYGGGALLLLAGLLALSRVNFLLFHSFAEIFSIVIAVSTALVAWNARSLLDNDYLFFVGTGQFFAALIDVLHLLAYKGMGVFSAGGANLSTQLWIAARYLAASALVCAALFLRRRVRLPVVLPVFAAVTAALIAAVFLGYFPDCYREALTPFKFYSEIAISILFALAAGLLFRARASFDRVVLNLILASLLTRVGAELCFAVFAHVYDGFSFAGHYLRIIAFYLLYKAIVETGITRPFAILLNDLRQREGELENSVRELEAFSYSVSHDLRSPLSAVNGFAQLLERHEGEALSAQGREYIALIRSSARRMAELIEDLLSFSRASSTDIEVAAVDMTALANEIAGRLRAVNPGREIALHVDDGMIVKGDARLLRVALENILGNAWKFTSKHDSARIEVRETRAPGECIVQVRDDGAGFDRRKAEQLFRPFCRMHASTEFEGTGIGLATVSRIVERHGGRVWAESEVEKGTTISIALPD